MELEALVQSHAKQAGLSAKQAKQALKKLREGGLMAQIAPHLQEKLSDMNPNLTPRDRLRAKLNNARQSRATKEIKQATYEKQREEVHQREEKQESDKAAAKEAAKKKQKAHQQRLKDLNKKLGQISEELYLECLTRQRQNAYREEGERNRDKNIIELYCKQNAFADKIDMSDLLSDDEEENIA